MKNAVDAFNGFVKSFNTWLTNNPPTSWGIKQKPQLIEQRVPAPNSTLLEAWEQTFDNFKQDRRDAFTQVYWLAMIAMEWDASAGIWTGPAFATQQEALSTRLLVRQQIREAMAKGDTKLAVYHTRMRILLDKEILKQFPNIVLPK